MVRFGSVTDVPQAMSDVCELICHVCFGPQTDITAAPLPTQGNGQRPAGDKDQDR